MCNNLNELDTIDVFSGKYHLLEFHIQRAEHDPSEYYPNNVVDYYRLHPLPKSDESAEKTLNRAWSPHEPKKGEQVPILMRDCSLGWRIFVDMESIEVERTFEKAMTAVVAHGLQYFSSVLAIMLYYRYIKLIVVNSESAIITIDDKKTYWKLVCVYIKTSFALKPITELEAYQYRYLILEVGLEYMSAALTKMK